MLAENSDVRGYKKRLADSAGCQPAYFSQVMNEAVHLTPEQAERLCSFWLLNDSEADFFFHLVLLGRAGSTTLSRMLERKLEEIRKGWQTKEHSFGVDALSEPERAAIYYAHWMNSAVHLLLTIPKMNTVRVLSAHLRRNEAEILAVLEDLERAGLCMREGEKWKSTQSQIHAPQKDFFAEIHHKNWRSQAIEVRAESKKSVVRYTSVHTLSEADLLKMKTMINELIQSSRLLIEPSKDEVGACLVIDYFSV